jgi:hypothetical protein
MEYEAGTFLLGLPGFWDDNIGYTKNNGKYSKQYYMKP